MFLEGWTFFTSLYYSVGAVATAGVMHPKCEDLYFGISDDL
jgi:hypothetical protein